MREWVGPASPSNSVAEPPSVLLLKRLEAARDENAHDCEVAELVHQHWLVWP